MVRHAAEHARLAGAAHALHARAGWLDADRVEGFEYGPAGRHRDCPAAARKHDFEAALDHGPLGAAAISDLDEEFWHFGLTLFALGGVSPWISMTDPVKYHAHVDQTQNLDITTIAACHTPVLEGDLIDAAFAWVRELPNADAPPMPDQAVLEQIVAAMTAGA